MRLMISSFLHSWSKDTLKVVIFFSTCDSVDFHHTVLSQLEWSSGPQLDVDKKQKFLSCKVFRLHGDMEQDDRKKSFLGFGSEKSAILVSTDIAARGLDFPKVKYIDATKKLARDAFCSWVRAYTAHRGELKKIFMVKKLHLGHVARSFGLKEQPSLVGRSHQVQLKKRKKEQKREGSFAKRRKLPSKK
nr:unnamed protein product [Digitaria exilis]